jgi:anti-sigma factor RsiW
VSGHESELLGAYVLGVLDGEEWATVRSHLDGCAACRREVGELREMEAALGEIPPEALLDGPPPDGSGLLRSTLVSVRDDRRRRAFLWVLAAVVVAVAALAGGVAAGRWTARDAPATNVAAAASGVAGARTATATDPATSVGMTVSVAPAAGWVRVSAVLSGVPAGEQCRIFVVSADGARQQAASWLAAAGSNAVDGSALMAPAEVTTVQAETYAGQILVAVPL